MCESKSFLFPSKWNRKCLMGSNEAERYSMYPEEGKKEYATKFDSTDGKDKKNVSH